VNEAAASSLPLVISRPCAAASALVEPGVNGFLVYPRNVQDIANAIGKLMTLGDDERWAMGAASKRIVSDWSTERYAQGLRSACEAALDCPPRTLGFVDRALLRVLSHMRITGSSERKRRDAVDRYRLAHAVAFGRRDIPHRSRARPRLERIARADVTLYGICDEAAKEDANTLSPVSPRAYWPSVGAFAYAPRLSADLLQSRHDVVHQHGLWLYPSIAVSRWQRRSGKPTVISTQGMLEPWAVAHSSAKKRVRGPVFERVISRTRRASTARKPRWRECARTAAQLHRRDTQRRRVRAEARTPRRACVDAARRAARSFSSAGCTRKKA
jgi:glycosyltransferase involved in cell wall biosynthesis